MNNGGPRRMPPMGGPMGPGGRPGGGRGGPMMAKMHAEKPRNLGRVVKRLLHYIGKNKKYLIGLLFLMACVTAVDLLGPMFQKKAIDAITLSEGKIRVDMDALGFYLAVMAVAFMLGAILNFMQGILSAKLSQMTVYSLRKDLFEKITRLPIGYVDTHKHGDIMSRMTNDVENVSNAVSQSITSLISSIITVIGAATIMFYYSWEMTLIAMITIPLTVLTSSSLAKFMRKYFVRSQVLLGQMNGHVEEMVTSYKTVVAYGKEGEAVNDFTKTSGEYRECSISAKVWGSIMGPIMNFLGNLQYVLLAGYGGFCMIRSPGRLTIGTIQAMLQYSKKFSRPIDHIANQYATILTALAGAERIFEIMDTPDEIDEGTNSIADMRGNIEFIDVDFSYVEGHPVLKRFNLSVSAGQKIAIVGATGSGKTTVVNLLTRFYEINSGKILIDGVDIRDIPKDELRSSIAMVLQDTVLFNDTVGTNIRYGKLDSDDEALKRAAHAAKADVFIDRLPDGYATVLTESGSNLSQGQRQLLSIARAVLADTKILILDEATSSVDTRTEMHIQQAMIALMKNRTSIIIAHRLSTIRDADVIVVLKNGEIAEAGDHESLLAKGGEYFALYENQFAGIET